ncbi:MAG: hypothetical protein RI554_02495, partial [Trueperaceae bacterium]|nr:hypothetical protein [Trueperaceae bacterium]
GALAPAARTSARALAHLRAGGDVAAVATVAGAPAASVRTHLEAAVRLGVATADRGGAGGARRFRLRPDVAWALRAEAAGAPDAAAHAERHAAWVRGAVDALVADDGDRPVGAASAAMLDRLDDVEAALDHDADADPARALHVASRAWPAYRRIGRATYLLRYVAPQLDAHAGALPREGVATAWATRGSLETVAAQLPAAKASFHVALEAYAAADDGAGQARVHLNLAQVEARLQALDAAERHLHRGQALAEAHERPWVAAACIGNRGHVLRRRGDRAGAAAAYRDAIARLQPLNDPYSVAGLRIAELGLLATDGLPADVVRGVHRLDLELHAVDGTQRQSLRRPFGAMRDAVAASGHDVAAERLDGVARDHRLA